MLFLYIYIVLNFLEMVNIIFISGRELDVDWLLSVNGIVDYYILYLILDYVYQINVTDKVFISYYRFISFYFGEIYTVYIRLYVVNVMSLEVIMLVMICKCLILGKQSLIFEIYNY